jgi:hypothetical protein
MKKIFYLFIVFFVLIASCKEETPIYLPTLEYKDAKALFLTESTGEVENNNFYQITKENIIKNITFLNTDGSVLYNEPGDPYLTATGLLRGSNFFLIDFWGRAWGENGSQTNPNNLHVLNKADNSYYSLGEYDLNRYANGAFAGTEDIISDGSSFYFLNYSYELMKLTQSFTVESVTPTGKWISLFETDNFGNILYSDNTNEVYLKSKYGSIISLSDNLEKAINGFWLGSNYSFYLFCTDATNNKSIVKLNITDTNVELNEVFQINEELSNINFIYQQSYIYKLPFVDLTLFINSTYSESITNAWIYDEVNDTIRNITKLTAWDEIIDIDQAVDNFFMATENNIIKVDLNFNTTELLPIGGYEIYSMSVNYYNEVLFNAIQNSSGKVIIGEIDSEGNIKIIDESINQKLEYLEYYKLF